MYRPLGSLAGTRHLEVGGSGPQRVVMIGALLVIIAGGLGLAAWNFFGDDDLPGDVDEVEDVYRYQCAQDGCGHEFTMDAPQREQFVQSLESGSARHLRYLPHCPKCETRHASVRMFDCPKCGKKYVPFGAKAAWMVARGTQRPSAEMTDVCPHCNTDIIEFRTAKMRKKR